ncbi:MAG: AMP-binding protein [Burkholderiales bacterium]|nr:AMP-binding protein [Burkholderiales bacterium]
MIESILTPELIERYTRCGAWGNRIWPDYIDETARGAPDRTAVIDSRGSMTYAELSRLIDRLALHLVEHGIRKEDRFGIQLPNWREFLLMRFALAKIGAIAVPLPIDWRQKEVQHVLAATEAAGVLVPRVHHDRDYVREIRELESACPSIRMIVVARADDALGLACERLDAWLGDPIEQRTDRSVLERLRPDANDIDLVVTTSGSTAAPKMIVRTANCFMATARQFADHRGHLSGADVVAAIAPIARGMGYYVGVAGAILGGSSMALLERFTPQHALSWLESTRATVAVAVPTQIVKMLEAPDLDRYDLGNLRILVNGGAAIAPSVAEEAERRLGCVLLTAYGSVEGATPTCTAPDDPPLKRYRSVGRTMPGMELRIVDSAGEPLPVGSAGEVVYRGPGMSLGFWRNAQGYAAMLGRDGWFPSGDLGVLDGEGYLTIVGRIKEIIIRGGINISPTEVEGLLQEHPEVAAVAVVKMPDPVLGERCCAFVVPVAGKTVSVASLARFLEQKGVAKYKFPERAELRSRLPTTPDGSKIMRKALEDEIADLVARESSASFPRSHSMT